MRRPLVLVLAALSLAAACSAPAARPPVEVSRGDLPFLTVPPPAPPATVYADPTVDPPGPRLPVPIPIPADDYAPEPVRQIGTMEIPAIGLRHRLFQGVTLNNIDRGPSHWTGSAMPGQMGNTVIAGHRATHSQPFRRIDALVAGDEVIFTVDDVRSVYRVTGHLIVRPADSWIADQTTAFTGTLYACHPVGSTAERYVVRMTLVGS